MNKKVNLLMSIVEDVLDSAANETLIRQFGINWLDVDPDGFPSVFTLNFSAMSTNFDAEFVRYDVPKSDDIYVIDPGTKQPVKHIHSNSKEAQNFLFSFKFNSFFFLFRNMSFMCRKMLMDLPHSSKINSILQTCSEW